MENVLPLSAVRDLLPVPNLADDTPDPFMAIDLATGESMSDDELARIAAWLTLQPLPIVAINTGAADGPGRAPIRDAADVHADSMEDFTRLKNAITVNPLASALLVQVLRSVPHLPVELALGVESLAYATLQGGEEFARWLDSRRAPRAHPPATAPVLLERAGEHLAITLNSPQNRNALSVTMRDALTDAFKLVAADPSIATVDVLANGPCFSAGGDLSEFGSIDDIALAHRIRTLRMPAQYLAQHASRYTFHLHGACIGAGIELPAFAGRLLAAPDTRFRLPEVAMGLIPGAGGCVSISRRIGRQRTAWMAITGMEVHAEQALEWGLVDAIERS